MSASVASPIDTAARGTRLFAAVTQTKYPLRFWMLVLLDVGIPNFIKFDSTNLTHKVGLFNLDSLSNIGLMMIAASMLAVVTLLDRQAFLPRRIDYCKGLWIALLVELLLATLLGPGSRLHPASHLDLYVGLYRLFEWFVAFLLLITLYSREPAASSTDLMIRIIAWTCWTNILLIWIMLPIAPSLVYAVGGEAGEITTSRLGGIMIHPLGLALYGEITFFHALIFLQGWRRYCGCCLALLTLALTYARSAELGFIATLLLYLIIFSRKTLYRWFGVLLTLVGGLGAIAFQEKIVQYAERGNGMKNIASLSDRTYVWQAAWSAFLERPLLGYGFVDGVKSALADHWKYSHWIPPHCHNELLQALVSGGAPAALLLLILFGQTVWKALRTFGHGPRQTFLLIVLMQLLISSLGGSLVTGSFARSGSLFLAAFLAITGGYRAIAASKIRYRRDGFAFSRQPCRG